MEFYNAGFCKVEVRDKRSGELLTKFDVNIEGVPSDVCAKNALKEIKKFWNSLNVNLDDFKAAARRAYAGRVYHDLKSPVF